MTGGTGEVGVAGDTGAEEEEEEEEAMVGESSVKTVEGVGAARGVAPLGAVEANRSIKPNKLQK